MTKGDFLEKYKNDKHYFIFFGINPLSVFVNEKYIDVFTMPQNTANTKNISKLDFTKKVVSYKPIQTFVVSEKPSFSLSKEKLYTIYVQLQNKKCIKLSFLGIQSFDLKANLKELKEKTVKKRKAKFDPFTEHYLIDELNNIYLVNNFPYTFRSASDIHVEDPVQYFKDHKFIYNSKNPIEMNNNITNIIFNNYGINRKIEFLEFQYDINDFYNIVKDYDITIDGKIKRLTLNEAKTLLKNFIKKNKFKEIKFKEIKIS
jgi:hypothetical protein